METLRVMGVTRVAAVMAAYNRRELTYGGAVQPSRWRPLLNVLVEPGSEPRPCDTMNGNALARRVAASST